jgi:tripartite-type tricarboxylate transporter receptor subunit TctC
MMPTPPDVTRRRLLAAAAASPFASTALAAGNYPSRPITLVVPFAAGGIADLTARVAAEAMARDLGQPVVIDNRPSAGNIVGSAAVAQARADGHALLLLSNGNAVSASLFRRLPYDVEHAFAPISTIGFFDLAVLVDRGARYRTLADLLDDARARPGKLTMATITPGSTQHLAAELFRSTAGIDVLIVPYKASPALLGAVRAREVDVAFEILGPMLAQIRAGVVRPLAVTSQARFPGLADVPAVRETKGLAGYAVSSWNALAAPASTPQAVVERLGKSVHAALAQLAVRTKLDALGVRPLAGSPAELQALLTHEIARWRAVIAAAHIELQ